MIKGHLQSLEKEHLSQFRFGFEVDLQNELLIESKDLLNEKKLINYLQIVKEKIHAPNMMVTASLFSKRYSYLLVVPALYSMTRFDKFLNVSIENVKILDHYENYMWVPKLLVKDESILMANTENERIEWRSYYFQKIFLEHLSEVWDILSFVGKIPKQILWENTAIYVFWLYETVLQDFSAEKAKGDFQFLFEADHSIFGNYIKNQLKNDCEIRPRKTCCLSYQISEKNMCKTCPKKL